LVFNEILKSGVDSVPEAQNIHGISYRCVKGLRQPKARVVKGRILSGPFQNEYKIAISGYIAIL
jgi:hypothetical protein